MVSLPLITIFSRDMQRSCDFYSQLLDLPEIVELRSPVYRTVRCGDLMLGFHSDEAYDLLDLRERAPGNRPKTLDVLFTFYVPSPADLDALVIKAQDLGGKVLKAAYETYYKHYQVVLSDLDDTVFRLSTLMEGAVA